MKSLNLLILINQTNLDRLRSRLRYSRNILRSQNLTGQLDHGPYANYWEEWTLQAEFLLEELSADIATTSLFVDELKAFLNQYQKYKRLTLKHKNSYVEMQKLATEALAWQKDMLKLADEKISLHREFTHKLLLVEAIDNNDDE